MKFSKFAAVSALTVAALSLGTSVGSAAPVPAPANVGVHYDAHQAGNSAVITIDQGSFDVANGLFKIKAPTGQTLAGTELRYYVDDIGLPIDVHVNGHTATLTPSVDPKRAFYHPADLPFQDTAPWKTPYDREQAAWNRFKDTVGVATALSAIVGAVLGGGAGCLVGLALGTAAGTPAPVIGNIFGAFAGCAVGALAVGPLGAIAGLIFIGAPIAIAAGVQYFTTINAPFVPKK